jgi:hypothetical protein
MIAHTMGAFDMPSQRRRTAWDRSHAPSRDARGHTLPITRVAFNQQLSQPVLPLCCQDLGAA